MNQFEVITMLTKTGKTLYLEMIDTKGVWTFKIEDACYFESEMQARHFANKYFKRFDDWQVETITVDFNRL